MFGNLFRREPAPATSPANPGKGTELRIRDAQGKETTVKATDLLADVLRQRGYKVRTHASWLALEGGLVLQPRIVEAVRAEQGGCWQTTTTIEAQHPDFFPAGVFEFQHSRANDVGDVLRGGFEQFESLDLPVLRAAISRQSHDCTFMEFKARYHTTPLARARRIVLGPVSWGVDDSAAAQAEEHPFCPCCFFTHARSAMEKKVAASGLFAVRMLAARYPGEGVEADCRVNGLDWPAGKEALLAYAATWPERGFEMRKQYVIIQDLR